MQGWIWAGTSAAIMPAFVVFPALVMLFNINNYPRMKKYGLLCVYVLICMVSFYYQSRSLWLSLFAFVLICFYAISWRKAALLLFIFLFLVVSMPWDKDSRLTGTSGLDALTDGLKNLSSMEYIQYKLNRFALSSGGDSISRIIGVDTYSIFNTQYTPATPAIAVHDLDRYLATKAAVDYLLSSNLMNKAIGYGFYTHRYNLIPSFQEVARTENYAWPERYSKIVRTAAFNGMLVDGGIVGMLFLFSLYAIMLYRSFLSRAYQSPVIMLCVGILVAWQLVASTYDTFIFYCALMPYGPLMAMLGSQQDQNPIDVQSVA